MNSEHEPVRVEIDQFGQIVRIFRTAHEAIDFAFDNPLLVKTMQYRDAVETVRRKVFEKFHGECLVCGRHLTWNMMHMHEVVPRSKGGEISVTNSVCLCYHCHLGREDSEHSERRWGGKPNL